MMTEGTKNTVIGVFLTAMLGGIATVLGLAFNTTAHLTKIDMVLDSQKDILQEMRQASSTIPGPIELKLQDLRNRINNVEVRMNDITKPLVEDKIKHDGH